MLYEQADNILRARVGSKIFRKVIRFEQFYGSYMTIANFLAKYPHEK